MVSIEKIHPTGQAITLLAQKYDLPSEVEKKIQDLVFCNKLPKIDMEFVDKHNLKFRYVSSYDHHYYKNKMNLHGFRGYSNPHPYSQFIYPKIDIQCAISSYDTVPELKATLKQLIKYNKLKIPISRLKRNELISLLIHTEF